MCNDGYVLRGPDVRVCENSGTWSLVPPVCEGKLHSKKGLSSQVVHFPGNAHFSLGHSHSQKFPSVISKSVCIFWSLQPLLLCSVLLHGFDTIKKILAVYGDMKPSGRYRKYAVEDYTIDIGTLSLKETKCCI